MDKNKKEIAPNEAKETIEPQVISNKSVDPQVENIKTVDMKKLEEEKMENPMGFKVILREFEKDKVATVAFWLIVAFLSFIIITSFFISEDLIVKVDIFEKYARPSKESFWTWFGKDSGGRSVMALTIVGARNSVLIGFGVTVITTFVGLFVGLMVGYYGGKFDSIVMRIVDFISLLPVLMIIIVIVTMITNFTAMSLILIMSAFYWIGTARLVRSKALSESRRDYVNASKTMGTSDLKIMYGGILPNISSILIVDSTLALAGNIGIETSLSFLGFGLPANVPSLGTLIALASKPEIIQDKPYVWVPASLTILFLMLCINYVGQALRRASDARQRLG